ENMFELYYKVLSQNRKSKNKVYSLHEPDVVCVSKGKEHKQYEFGNKVSILRSWSGLILGACSFRNEYDGHTIEKTLEQTQRMTGKQVDKLAGDRGYRGLKQIGKTKILIPDTPKAKDSYYQKRKKHKLFCKRAGIEPTIGHLKADHRLSRNFYKGVKGDAINVLLAAAAYNFKRAMRVLLYLIKRISIELVNTNFILKYSF
ncbi:transposase, partial [Prevotella pallens]